MASENEIRPGPQASDSEPALSEANRVGGPGAVSPISLPAPTAWPLVLAFGLTLVVTGLVTAAAVSVLGAALSLLGAVGWFRDVLPHERHVALPVREEVIVIATERRKVAGLKVAPELQRARFPIEVFPVTAGIRGGLAGSVAMAAVAMLYGLIAQGSVWYPVNLLGGVVYTHAVLFSAARLSQFTLVFFLVAIALHVTTSLLVGLLYGTMLPMLPRHPILLGGVIAPVFWSGLVHSVLGLVHPLMDARINWWWFTASQVAFGIVAGLVVNRHSPVRVRQFPLAMRAGIEATGLPEEHDGDEGESS
jgi:hypothetical protein